MKPETVIFFGAGASYGSDSHIRQRQSNLLPPLGKDLYTTLLEFDNKLWSQVAEAFTNPTNFEDGWQRLQEQCSKRDLILLLRSMARFFHTFKPSATNLYREIARRVRARGKNWPGCFVTLNYEALLQHSLQMEELNYFISAPGPSYSFGRMEDIEVCIPHGYIHVYMNFHGFETAMPYASNALGYFHSEYLAAPEWIADDMCAPVLSYYTLGKDTDYGSDFISWQKGRFSKIVNCAKTIIMVGVAYNPSDTHIWTPLKTSGASIYYVEPGNADRFIEWSCKAQHQKQRTIEVIKDSFDGAFEQICRLAGLGDEVPRWIEGLAQDANSDEVDQLVNLAIHYETQLHDLETAEHYYKRALAVAPNNANANSDYAVLLLKRGQIDMARECMEKALAVDPMDAITHNNYGQLLADSGDRERAVRHMRKAIMLDPTYASPYYNLGKIMSEAGHTDKAHAYWRHAVTLQPSHWPAEVPMSVLEDKNE